LSGFLGVVVARVAIDFLGLKQRRELPTEDRLLMQRMIPKNPELEILKHSSQEDFKRIFQEAFAALTSRERNILRKQLLDGLSIDKIGAIYRIHRSTAARWLERIRSKLQERTRQLMMERLRLSSDELESLMALVLSHFEMSLQQVLLESEKRNP
jgi:RNA polymerase sigma-70 factor (ECF subfamily)